MSAKAKTKSIKESTGENYTVLLESQFYDKDFSPFVNGYNKPAIRKITEYEAYMWMIVVRNKSNSTKIDTWNYNKYELEKDEVVLPKSKMMKLFLWDKEKSEIFVNKLQNKATISVRKGGKCNANIYKIMEKLPASYPLHELTPDTPDTPSILLDKKKKSEIFEILVLDILKEKVASATYLEFKDDVVLIKDEFFAAWATDLENLYSKEEKELEYTLVGFLAKRSKNTFLQGNKGGGGKKPTKVVPPEVNPVIESKDGSFPLWDRCLALLKNEVNGEVFKSVFSHLQFQSIENEQLNLIYPNKKRDFLVSNYKTVLKTTTGRVFGENVKINLITY